MSQLFIAAEAANNLAVRATFHRIEVHYPETSRLLQAFADLELCVPKDDEFWDQFIRRLRRLRFDILSTPLPLSDPALGLARRTDDLEAMLFGVEALYPDAANAAAACIFRLRQISVDDSDPLGEEFIGLCLVQTPASTALLMRSVRSATAVQMRINQLEVSAKSRVRVVAGLGSGLLGFYDIVVCAGPFRWFSPAVIESPRAPTVVSICYADVTEANIHDRRLPGSERSALKLDLRPIKEIVTGLTLEPEAVLPSVNWNLVIRSGEAGRSAGDDDDEDRLAYPVLLAGGYGAMLDASPGATALILDIEAAKPLDRLRRISTGLLAEGMYVVLRTEGGGDFVAAVADRLLGAEADRLRGMQREWKLRLHKVIANDGWSAVAKELTNRGAVHATTWNLRRWVGDEALRTELATDFTAIMSLIGLSSDFAEYWSAMGKLQAAHQAAGSRIRNMLLKQIGLADFSSQADPDRIDFVLEDDVGGTLSAIRIEDRSDEPALVARSRLGRLSPVSDY